MTESSSGNGSVSITPSASGRFTVRGPLTFATARRALKAGLDAFASASGPLEVDCSGIGQSDTAGLAVLIEWLAWARRKGRDLHYTGVPETICAVARISEAEGLLLRR